MNIKEKAISGIKWNSFSTIICTLLQILRLSILTYLLDKSDFGLIAIAMMVISFTEIFSDLGITVALIHKQNINENQYSSVFWLNVITSVFLTLILCLISPVISNLYSQPSLIPIISLLSLQILFNGFGKMFQTIKVKDLDYGFISKVKIFSTLIGFFITIFLAINGLGVFSLVLGQIIQIGIIQFIYSISGLKQHKIKFYFSFHDIKDIFTIGSWQIGAKLLDFISNQIDVILIGKFFSMNDLGIYNIAKDLILKPYQIINNVSSGVFSSAFAKVQNEICLVLNNYKRLVSTISVISTFIYFVIFIFSDLIVNILYSEDFAEVSDYLKILSFVGLLTSITSQGAVIEIAFGRTDIGFKWTIVRTLISFFILIITSFFTIKIVAYGQLFLSVITLFLFFFIVLKPILKIMTLGEYIQTFLPIIKKTSILSLPFIIVLEVFDLHIVFQVLLVLVFLFSYIFLLLKIYPNTYKILILKFMKKRF